MVSNQSHIQKGNTIHLLHPFLGVSSVVGVIAVPKNMLQNHELKASYLSSVSTLVFPLYHMFSCNLEGVCVQGMLSEGGTHPPFPAQCALHHVLLESEGDSVHRDS